VLVKITKDIQSWLAKESGFVIFLSFDIMGSTAYKLSNSTNWMFHFSMFFRQVRNIYNNGYMGLNCFIWKELGDEVIIVFFPRSKDDLKSILDIAINSVNGTNEYREVLQRINLDYKTTLFCAGYCEPTPFTMYNESKRSDIDTYKSFMNLEFKNHRMHHAISYSQESFCNNQPSSCRLGCIIEYDFIGPDIDIGFRISKKYSRQGNLLVSDKIAYLYSKMFPNEYLFRIICKKRLKGVWHNIKYPIIYYGIESNILEKLMPFYKRIKSIETMNNFYNCIDKLTK
jgi:hypothetical protein